MIVALERRAGGDSILLGMASSPADETRGAAGLGRAFWEQWYKLVLLSAMDLVESIC